MILDDAAKEATLTDFQGRLEARTGFDPSILIEIADAVLSVLRNVCPPPAPAPGPAPTPSLQVRCQEGGILARLRLRRALVEQGVAFRHIPQAIDAVLAIGAEASDEDVAKIYGCVE